ncbi:penicillin-binding protein, partial [Methylorubrum extorquens DSM 13060]
MAQSRGRKPRSEPTFDIPEGSEPGRLDVRLSRNDRSAGGQRASAGRPASAHTM